MMKHKTPIQIRFKDLDILGHVNNANYFSYFEIARIQFFNTLMKKDNFDWSEKGIIMANVFMNFKKPIFLNDEICVYTWVSKLGNKSFEMNCSIIKTENKIEAEVANGNTILVCINYKTNETIEIPKEWRQKMEPYLIST